MPYRPINPGNQLPMQTPYPFLIIQHHLRTIQTGLLQTKAT
ncbi:hypothetical protein EIKCOROL_02129 [Eikenella corrodens ATCC 23834]|uniref:Uncharacterized protein n=1 Tax=Eikenella corrodens ATCC 23834 TaxID=546274 RepID=C0DXL8_EIKCO|nr:hypothetical protein EIKCOROL_02129 [Eikenella corrodens ATCC 23834]